MMFSFGLENAADVRCCFRAAVTRPRRYPLTPEKLLDDFECCPLLPRRRLRDSVPRQPARVRMLLAHSLNNLVSAPEQRERDREAEGLGGLEI
jgi:hypothetical protein